MRLKTELQDNIQGMNHTTSIIVDETVQDKYEYFLEYDYIEPMRNTGYRCTLFDKVTGNAVATDYDNDIQSAVDRCENIVLD